MLECIPIIRDVIIIIIRISEKVIIHRKNIFTAQVWRRQTHLLWISNVKDLFGVIIQILTHFVAQIGIRVPVANDLLRTVDTNRPVIRCNHDFTTFLRQTFEQFKRSRMLKP